MYGLIFGKRKKFEINTADLEYKVHYLGNVMTSIMKGDGCVDKAVNILWDNHLKHNGKAGIRMNLTLTQGGLKVETDASGVTEYYGHRIHYIIAHPMHPKLFVWVYQHVGRNLKTELRCHGALCKHSKDAKLIAFMLNERLERTFAEYKREKKRMQTTRLCNSKNRVFLLAQQQHKQPMRKKSLSSTVKYYKPPVQRSMISAPKLDDVQEDDELIENNKEDSNRSELIVDECGHFENCDQVVASSTTISDNASLVKQQLSDDSSSIYSNTFDSGIEESFTINYEFGNDLEQLKQDKELIKAYEELIINNNDTSNQSLNDLTLDLNQVLMEQQSPSMKVSYDYLADFSTKSPEIEPIIKKTKSFRVVKPKQEHNLFLLRNPFKRLQLSSSFSGYSTYEKYKQKQQQQQQQANVETNDVTSTSIQEVVINC